MENTANPDEIKYLQVLPEKHEHTHIHLNSKYEMQFEQAPSATKGILGFKVTAHRDSLEDVKRDIRVLLQEALDNTKPPELILSNVHVNGKPLDEGVKGGYRASTL